MQTKESPDGDHAHESEWSMNAPCGIWCLNFAQIRLAPFMQDIVNAQVNHDSLPGLIRKNYEKGSRQTCGSFLWSHPFVAYSSSYYSHSDRCSTSILSATFLCSTCGYEICTACHMNTVPVIPNSQSKLNHHQPIPQRYHSYLTSLHRGES